MPGYSPAYSIAPALILEDGKLLIKPLGGVKGHIEVWTSSTSTVVAGFEDADTDSDEDGVQSQAELKNVFAIPPDAVKMMLVVAAKYTLRDVSGQEALTALSSCWHEEGGISYDVAAYTIEKKDGGMVDIITGDDKRTTTETLPFVATNSICQRGETYLFGRNGGTPAAAKISYEPQTKRFTLERIDPKDAPLQPYFGEIRE